MRATRANGRLVGTVLTAGLAAGVSLASCQMIAGVDGDFRLAPAVGNDAGDAGDASAPDTGPPVCMSATYPDPPSGMDVVEDGGAIVVAVHTVDLGDMNDTPGYDLDHTCTCFGDAGNSCVGRATTPSTYCDGPNGIDDEFGKILNLIEAPLGSSNFGSVAFSTQADQGRWSLLIEITGYNGAHDDPGVSVALYPCPGLGTTPKWDGTDSWPVLDTAVSGTGTPVYVSNGAYVSGQTLVATVPSVPIVLAGTHQTLSLTLSGAVLTGKLVQTQGQWRLVQGVLAARLGLTDFFKTLSSYRNNNGTPLCNDGNFIYQTVKTSICNDADITVDGTLPKSAKCDAVSFGMGFSADPAIRGPNVPVPTPTPGCPAATDPANDSCGP